VAVKIKLKRLGKIRAPYYRIVVADSRTKRDGRAIEEIGKYHPKSEPSLIEVDSERAQHWLSVGAQPTDPVRKLLEVTGDWQKFKGLPGAEGTLRTATPKADKKDAFAAAVAESLADSGAKPQARGKAADAKAKAADTKTERPARARKPAAAKEPTAAAESTPAAEQAEPAAAEPAAAEPSPAESTAAAEPAAAEPAAAEPSAAESTAAAESSAAEQAEPAAAETPADADTASASDAAPASTEAESSASDGEQAAAGDEA
jgi:small subunit ribosomal protein S16